QDHARRCGSARLSGRQLGEVRARYLLLLFRRCTVGRPVQELEEIYFTMVESAPTGFVMGPLPYHWAQVDDIKRDPFETAVGDEPLKCRWRFWRTSDRLCLRLESPPHWPVAVAEGTRDLH